MIKLRKPLETAGKFMKFRNKNTIILFSCIIVILIIIGIYVVFRDANFIKNSYNSEDFNIERVYSTIQSGAYPPEDIGIVSDKRNSKGIAYIIHNEGQFNREEDYLKRAQVTGHYRFDFNLLPADIIAKWPE